MKEPKIAKLTPEEQKILIEHINADSLNGDDKEILIELLKLYDYLKEQLKSSSISIKKLQEMLLGFKADKLKKLHQIQ